ncbi:MAG TPA: nickel pincer cofactor biosynthesis protein LarC [Dissulfurispiraceae bacterium]|nr:nickel pincer cofactor biosynthesis protein LarC [Dissulfurispiraceae bacterium]
MKIAYLDCFSGISGDMLLGALVSAGLPLAQLKKGLKLLPIKGYRIASSSVRRSGVAATKIDVKVDDAARPARTWKDVSRIVKKSMLPSPLKVKGLEIFRRLFEAEAKVHGVPFDQTHLHELSAVDCIVDIFGTVIGFAYLGIERIVVSPINLGSGMVKTSHGLLPVPAPATVELLRDLSVYGSPIPHELATPTGAAILTGLGAESGCLPLMRAACCAHGAGHRDLENQPNVLRMITGEPIVVTETSDSADAVLIETNIDDMNPQLYEDVMDKLLNAGALDVWLEHLIMKKGRPGIKLNILASGSAVAALADIVFRHTSTIGIRYSPVRRLTLDRSVTAVRLPQGNVRIKSASLGGMLMNQAPEYEDLKVLSQKTGQPIKRLAIAAMAAAATPRRSGKS